MLDLAKKDILVAGLDEAGRAACELLCTGTDRIVCVDRAATPELQGVSAYLRALGAEVLLGASELPKGSFDLAVVTPSMLKEGGLLKAISDRGIPTVSDLELAALESKCLSIAVAGAAGKSTTLSLVKGILDANHRRTLIASGDHLPACSAVARTRELDYLLLEAHPFQLENTRLFRPVIAVLLNMVPHTEGRYSSMEDYARACAGLFRNQQVFDWAIIQAEALTVLREMKLPLPSKVISFSASDTTADLHLDRGFVISRLGEWQGPLIDMDQCVLQGPHNAENLMASLAIGSVLRLSLEPMVEALKAAKPAPHCFEVVGEVGGVRFINDSKCGSLASLEKSLLAACGGKNSPPNIWLITGSHAKEAEYHKLGPILSRAVKRAFVMGDSGELARAAWSLFTPCTLAKSLLEAVTEAAKNATSGDVILLSPACSGPDQSRDYVLAGRNFCEIAKSISRGALGGDPNIDGNQ